MLSNQKQTKNKWKNWRAGFSWSNILFLPFLLLSIFFWLSTKLSKELQYRKTIHITYEMDEDFVLKNVLPSQLDAMLSGQGWDLIFLEKYSSQHPFIYRISRNSKIISKGDIISQLNRNVDNQGIRVEDLTFSSQTLEIEKRKIKKVPVYFEGRLEFGKYYKMLDKISFSPDSIELSGPESLVASIDKYPTETLEILDVEKDISISVELKAPDVHYLTLTPTKTQLQIKTEQLTQKTLLVPVRIANEPTRPVTIVPDQIEINFLIGLSEFQLVSAEDFSAQIVLAEEQLPNQQYAVSIVKKPVNAMIQEITPAYVDVFFGE